jgi:hypothetical protein
MTDATGAGWRKSSHSSGGQQGSCVEVARGLPGFVAVRDSKDPHGPVLTVEPGAWADFIIRIRSPLPSA